MDKTEFLKNLGFKIRILRQKNKLSQEQLAEAAEIDRGYVSTIERGETNATICMLKQIADALNVEIIELFNFTI